MRVAKAVAPTAIVVAAMMALWYSFLLPHLSYWINLPYSPISMAFISFFFCSLFFLRKFRLTHVNLSKSLLRNLAPTTTLLPSVVYAFLRAKDKITLVFLFFDIVRDRNLIPYTVSRCVCCFNIQDEKVKSNEHIIIESKYSWAKILSMLQNIVSVAANKTMNETDSKENRLKMKINKIEAKILRQKERRFSIWMTHKQKEIDR